MKTARLRVRDVSPSSERTDALRFDRLLGFAHASLMSYTVVALQWLPGSFLFSR